MSMTASATTITGVTASTVANLYVGQLVYSTIAGIGGSVTISSISGTTVTLSGSTSAALTAAQLILGSTGNTYTGGTVVNNGATLTLTPSGAGQVVIPRPPPPRTGSSSTAAR